MVARTFNFALTTPDIEGLASNFAFLDENFFNREMICRQPKNYGGQ